MSSGSMKKVYIQIESAAEQQEHIKSQRKTLKVLQGVATNKENLTGRPQLDKLSRLKAAATETTVNNSISGDYVKRKKRETRSVETQTSPEQNEKAKRQITEEDLTGDAKPSEYYWERLAEKRREALEKTLEENQRLYERIDGLDEELNTSRQQLEEAQHLVAVLTEMLEEDETDTDGVAAAEESTKAEADDSPTLDDSTNDSNVTPKDDA